MLLKKTIYEVRIGRKMASMSAFRGSFIIAVRGSEG